jgi:hypothetical protein
MTWAKGQSGNPNGRHPGKRGAAAGDLFIFRASKARSAKIFFLDAMDEERVPMELRLIAAREVAKWQIQPDPPLENPVPLVPTKCAADAEFNIEEINRYEAAGRIGHVSAEALRKGQRDWQEAHVISTVQHEGPRGATAI